MYKFKFKDCLTLICWIKNHCYVYLRGAWVAYVVKRPTLAQVTISWFMGLYPALGSVLTAQSLEPASDSVSPCLSAPPPLTLFLKKINKR